jgi:ATP-dependent protease ClpP protease subunit
MTTLDLYGEMTEATCGALERRLATVADDLTIRVDSPGGRVDCGQRLAVALERWASEHPDAALTIEVGAMACSMAANLLALAPARAAITGHAASMLMFHSCRGVAEGTPADMAAAAAYMCGVNRQVVDGLARRTGLAPETFRPWFRGGEKWLTGAEALELGIFGGLASGAAASRPESLVALYKLAARAASNPQTEEEKTMAEETKQPCAEETPGIVEEIKEEVKEELKEDAPAPAEEITEKTEEKVEAEDGGGMEEPETIEEVLAALRAKVAELTEEVAALKAAKAKLSGGLVLRKDAQAKAVKSWPELLKGIRVDQPPREYARAYAELKAKHQAEYQAYMQAHATVPRCN